jgi:hypothetical protein
MANATITVKEADGTTQTDVTVLDVGRQAAAASKSLTLSTEDKAVIDAIAASLALIDNSIPSGNELQVDVVGALPAGTNNIGDVDVLTVPADPFGVNADAASVSTSISAKLKAIATALGVTALDLGSGTGGTRTLRVFNDTAQMPAALGAGGGLKVQNYTAAGAAVDPVAQVAHGATDSGEPVKVGGKAYSAEPTPVTNAQRANFITDLVGKQIVLPYANPENFVSGAITTAMTGTTTTSLLAAPAAGLRNYITTIVVSCAHATVGTDIIIQDGSGGTTLMTIPAAAVYGGAVVNLPVPLRQPTTATAIFCANVTTGSSTKVSAVGYKGV